MRPATEGVAIVGLKAGAAASQFLLLVLTARLFGAGFRGEVALFGAAVNLLVLVVGFTGGASIVYLAAREPNRAYLRSVLLLSYACCVLIPSAVVFGAPWVGASFGAQAPWVALVSVTTSMLVVNSCVLLSGREVWQASVIEFLRPFSVVALALGVAGSRGFHSPAEFYPMWGAAAVGALLLSLPFLLRHYWALPAQGVNVPPPITQVFRQLTSKGSLVQASNVVQFLNYRSLFFALERSAGLAAVGVFSTAVALAEVLWIPVNSLAAMTLSRVSRLGAEPSTRAFVLRLTRLAMVGMLAAALAATVIPVGGITALLGRDFAGVRAVLLKLLPGVVALGVTMVTSSYNAGHGLYVRNLQAALAGLCITAVGYWVLIPRWGEGGAVLAMNLAYVATSLWLWVGFVRREKVAASEWTPRVSDFAARRRDRI